MSDFPNDTYLQEIERELREVVQNADPLYADFFTIFHYHLGWTDERGAPHVTDPGKRIRPLLCFWSCEGVGGKWHTTLPAAAALELVHNFSLIHDDIQDSSAERRGRPTVWKLWGLAQAINAGDALFALARIALDSLHTRVSPEVYADAHLEFDAATLALTQGQFLDLRFERTDSATIEEYFEMVRGKTAALFAAATYIGARVGTDDPRTVELFARYGESLGIAYQIADDILGIWGDPVVTGKPAGSDILARKKSLPILMGLQSNGELAAFFRQVDKSAEAVSQVIVALDRAQARQFAEERADEYLQSALAALDETGLDNPPMARLRELAQRTVRRDK